MTKVKSFRAETLLELEREINKFMDGKVIINISYAIDPNSIITRHRCLVLYNTVG